MKRFLLAIVIFLVLSSSANASHIFGGEMIYEYLGPGAAPNTKKYLITLRLFRDNNGGGAPMPPNVFIGVFDYGTKTHYPSTLTYYDVPKASESPVPINVSPCISGAVTGNYSIGTYPLIVDLPDNPEGYICAYETCCRIAGLQNVTPPGGTGGPGSTYVCRIPGANQLPVNQHNSSPQFITSLDVVCKENPFTWNFSAVDPDSDSLVYSFTSAYDRTIAQNAANVAPAPPAFASPPDYPLIAGANGFIPTAPLGPLVSINPNTGIISGFAPPGGNYVVGVLIKEFRNGIQISEHRKDFILRIQDCDIPKATLTPKPTTCDGFTVSFVNETPSPLINTYFWDFGVPVITNDTSNLPNPSYTYPYAGVFTVKLVTNRNQQCSDSTTTIVKVFPGFRPDFTAAGGCVTSPFQFNDFTQTDYGVVNSWSWNFGDLTTLADTSHLQNPQWTYASPGSKNITLIVTNDKGCVDTKQVTIDVLAKPVITFAFADTLICVPDAVTLGAAGTGAFNWTPLVNIVNANTATPTVNPTVDTWYVVNLNDNGCINKDSVHVRVVSGVSLTAIGDTTICLTDPVQLNANTNGLSFLWSPAGTLNDPTIKNPVATPTGVSTTYQVRAFIGSCFADDFVTITTVPYPVADAGAPQIVCFNKSAQLNGSHNGSTFSWTPSSYLNDPNILNPVATPPRTTTYILASFDNAGCPKPGRDTVVITMLPRVRAYAGRDTSVVIGQPLLFNGSGGLNYLWSPATGLTSTTIYNPVGVYNGTVDSIRYKLIVSDIAGCSDSAFVTVKIYKVKPTIFVPTAFTPNNDGKNDFIYPISVGIKKINYFSIYNRWGQLVFTTTVDRAGWDGTISGRTQDTGVFVWMVSAIDYTGKAIFLKGTVALIR
jgi:gliding motility-associated-like protein